jgi:hypothetical protein
MRILENAPSEAPAAPAGGPAPPERVGTQWSTAPYGLVTRPKMGEERGANYTTGGRPRERSYPLLRVESQWPTRLCLVDNGLLRASGLRICGVTDGRVPCNIVTDPHPVHEADVLGSRVGPFHAQPGVFAIGG